MDSDDPWHPDSGSRTPDGDVLGPKARLEAAKQGLDTTLAAEAAPKVVAVVSRPTQTPTTRRKPTITPDDEDEKGARWIFILMAVLLGVALIAQYVRSQG